MNTIADVLNILDHLQDELAEKANRKAARATALLWMRAYNAVSIAHRACEDAAKEYASSQSA